VGDGKQEPFIPLDAVEPFMVAAKKKTPCCKRAPAQHEVGRKPSTVDKGPQLPLKREGKGSTEGKAITSNYWQRLPCGNTLVV